MQNLFKLMYICLKIDEFLPSLCYRFPPECFSCSAPQLL